MILVAGLGSRLRPLTDDRPKALMDLGGETILARALRLLSSYGVERIVLATGYREDAVKSALGSPEWRALRCEVVRNPAYDRTQNSISLALCAGAVAGDAFFKLDGDVVFQPEVLERLDRAPAGLAVAVDRTRLADEEAMKIRLGPERAAAAGSIAAFGKGIPLAESAGESIGIERLSASAPEVVFEALQAKHAAGETGLYYEDVYSELIAARRLEATAVDVGDLPWTEVDTLEDLERARSIVSR